MVASKHSQNHFISEKYRAIQTFKQRFLENSPNVQLHTTSSDYKGAANIPGIHYIRAFLALPSYS